MKYTLSAITGTSWSDMDLLLTRSENVRRQPCHESFVIRFRGESRTAQPVPWMRSIWRCANGDLLAERAGAAGIHRISETAGVESKPAGGFNRLCAVDDTFWAAYSVVGTRICVVTDGEPQLVDLGFRPQHIHSRTPGALVIAGGPGVVRWTPEGTEVLASLPRLTYAVHEAPDGTVYANNMKQRLHRISDGEVTLLHEQQTPRWDHIFTWGDRLFAGGDYGLDECVDGTWTCVNSRIRVTSFDLRDQLLLCSAHYFGGYDTRGEWHEAHQKTLRDLLPAKPAWRE